MSNTERAAEIILESTRVEPGRGLTIRPHETAALLAAAGLLVTDEMTAVLDVARTIRSCVEACANDEREPERYRVDFREALAAVDAYLASRGDTESPPTVVDAPCSEGFHWIGQPLDHCDNCGHPARAHAGLHCFRDGAGPFGGESYCKPWAEVDASRGETT